MPVGYLLTVGVWLAGLVLSVAPLGRGGRRGRVSWIMSAVPNESPFIAGYVVVAATALAVVQGDLHGPAGWIAVPVLAVPLVIGPLLVERSLGAGAVLDAALDEGLGAGSSRRRGHRLPWVRIVVLPLPVLRLGIRRTRNVRYEGGDRHHRLDVYRHRRRRLRGPVLIHLHGGGFHMGHKSFEGRPVLHGLAERGWLCISANYRLQPAATFHEQVVDVKHVITWARSHAAELGADPGQVFVAGSSAGAHLAVTAALTIGDPAFQPGFEHIDTTVAGAVGLYGYYGPAGGARDRAPFAPVDLVGPEAPPVLIASGGQDTFVPAEHTSRLVSRLRAVSTGPVVDVELPHAQHSFDLVHSVRIETLVDGIDTFAAEVCRRVARHRR